MKKTLTAFILASLVFLGPNQHAWAQETEIKAPSATEAIEKLKKIKSANEQALTGILLSIVTSAAGRNLLVRTKSTKVFDAQQRQYADKKILEGYKAKLLNQKKPGVLDLEADILLDQNGQQQAKSLKFSDINIEIKTSKGAESSFPLFNKGEKYLEVSSPKYSELPTVKLSVNKSSMAIYESSLENYSAAEIESILTKASRMKIGGYALMVVAGASILYSLYNLVVIEEDLTFSESEITKNDITALLEYDYNNPDPIPSNLLQLLQDETLRAAIGFMSELFEEASLLQARSN